MFALPHPDLGGSQFTNQGCGDRKRFTAALCRRRYSRKISPPLHGPNRPADLSGRILPPKGEKPTGNRSPAVPPGGENPETLSGAGGLAGSRSENSQPGFGSGFQPTGHRRRHARFPHLAPAGMVIGENAFPDRSRSEKALSPHPLAAAQPRAGRFRSDRMPPDRAEVWRMHIKEPMPFSEVKRSSTFEVRSSKFNKIALFSLFNVEHRTFLNSFPLRTYL